MKWRAEICWWEWADGGRQFWDWDSISYFLVVEVWWCKVWCLSVELWICSKSVKPLQWEISWISISEVRLRTIRVRVGRDLYVLVSWTLSIMINGWALFELRNRRVSSWRRGKFIIFKAPERWSIIGKWVIMLVLQNLMWGRHNFCYLLFFCLYIPRSLLLDRTEPWIEIGGRVRWIEL